FKCGFGVAVGSEMSGGVKNVFVKDCCFENTYSIASIKAPRGRGGIIENIYYENNSLVKYKDELHDCEWFRGAVYIDQFYSCVEFRADLPKEVNAATPKIRNISIKNTSLETQSGNAVYIVGLPEMPIENITLENMTAVGKYGLKVKNVNGFKSKNICVKSCEDNDYEFKNTIFRWALYHKLRKKYNSP
ncbi:MAG: hypothetical protein LIO59_03600, partial [Oscillospiraceae bacterium]|nr:hypothetical protein [Oscillospiraceae bacterium]